MKSNLTTLHLLSTMYYGHLTLLSRLVINFSFMSMSEDKCKCMGLDDTS